MLLANLIWSDLTSTIGLGQFGGLDDVLHSFLPPWIPPFVSQQSPGLVALPVTAPEDGARKPGGDWQIGWQWRRYHSYHWNMLKTIVLGQILLPVAVTTRTIRICTYNHCEFSLFSLNGSGSTLKARLMHWKEWFLIGRGKAARYLYIVRVKLNMMSMHLRFFRGNNAGRKHARHVPEQL